MNKLKLFDSFCLKSMKFRIFLLMMGGDLPAPDDFSLKLIKDKDLLECNQNGIMDRLVHEGDGIEIRKTPKKNNKDGWIGIFNRSNTSNEISVSIENPGLHSEQNYSLHDVWNNMKVSTLYFYVHPNGVIFLKYFSNN